MTQAAHLDTLKTQRGGMWWGMGGGSRGRGHMYRMGRLIHMVVWKRPA